MRMCVRAKEIKPAAMIGVETAARMRVSSEAVESSDADACPIQVPVIKTNKPPFKRKQRSGNDFFGHVCFALVSTHISIFMSHALCYVLRVLYFACALKCKSSG